MRVSIYNALSLQDIVELVDVYPTIAELAGIPVPPDSGLDGTSLLSLMSGAGSAADNSSAFALSAYPRCPANVSDPSRFWADNDCLLVERTTFPFMGLSLRTARWRYTEWLPWNASLQVAWGSPATAGIELYDHDGDTGARRGSRVLTSSTSHPTPCASRRVTGTTFDGPWEQANLAGLPAYAKVQAQLAAQLQAAYPNAPAWGPQ